jgi:hypothetical protein
MMTLQDVENYISYTGLPLTEEDVVILEVLIRDGLDSYGGPGSGWYGPPKGDHVRKGVHDEGDRAGKSLSGEQGDISSEYRVSPEDLRDDFYSTHFVVDGQDVYIGRGVGYYPREGGSSEMFEGRVVAGPKEWVGKQGRDIPELQDAVNKEFERLQDKSNLGTYADAKYTDANSDIAKVLYAYKTPLATDANPLCDHFEAMASKGRLNPAQTVELKTANELKEIAKMENTAKGFPDSPDKQKLLQFCADQRQRTLDNQFTDTVSGVRELRHVQGLYNQETANQFYSEVQRTQKALKDMPENIPLYRGVHGEYADTIKSTLKSGNSVTIGVNSVSSWTSDKDTAAKFAGKNGVVIQKDIPKKDVLFSYKSSPYIRLSDYPFGGTEEYEYLVGNRSKQITLSHGHKYSKRWKGPDGEWQYEYPKTKNGSMLI